MSRKTPYEGWSYPIDIDIPLPGGMVVHLADHTWVNCPEIGETFVCWGGDTGDGNRRLVQDKKGYYAISNCYRHKHDGHRDTAGIAYGYNGVCHQTANLYMWPARLDLGWRPRGAWLSRSVWGTWGTALPLGGVASELAFWAWWSHKYYTRCENRTLETNGPDTEPEEMDPLLNAIADLYIDEAYQNTADPYALIKQETALITEATRTGIDYGVIEAEHIEMLQKRDEILGARPKGLALADQMNSALVEFQRALAGRLEAGRFEALMGTTPDAPFALVDPRIAETASDPALISDDGLPL